MVVTDLDVRGRYGCGTTAEDDVFARSFQVVVHNLERPHGMVATPASDGLAIGAGAGTSDRVGITEVGVDHGDVAHTAQVQATRGFVLGRSVQPDAVQNDVVCGCALLRTDQRTDCRSRRFAGDFYSDKSQMIYAIGEQNRSRTAFSRAGDTRHGVFRLVTMKIRTSGKRSHSGKTGRHASAFGRQVLVGICRANDDPVRVVALLLR